MTSLQVSEQNHFLLGGVGLWERQGSLCVAITKQSLVTHLSATGCFRPPEREWFLFSGIVSMSMCKSWG